MVNALSKATIAENLSDKLGIPKPIAKKLVEGFFEEIKMALAEGDSVKLSGYGNFNLRDKPARPGRNPKTGEEKVVHARRVVTFRPGLKLKNRIEKRGN